MIRVNGQAFRTLDDPITVNGATVGQVYANGRLVYPEAEPSQYISKFTGSIDTTVVYPQKVALEYMYKLMPLHAYRIQGCVSIVFSHGNIPNANPYTIPQAIPELWPQGTTPAGQNPVYPYDTIRNVLGTSAIPAIREYNTPLYNMSQINTHVYNDADSRVEALIWMRVSQVPLCRGEDTIDASKSFGYTFHRVFPDGQIVDTYLRNYPSHPQYPLTVECDQEYANLTIPDRTLYLPYNSGHGFKQQWSIGQSLYARLVPNTESSSYQARYGIVIIAIDTAQYPLIVKSYADSVDSYKEYECVDKIPTPGVTTPYEKTLGLIPFSNVLYEGLTEEAPDWAKHPLISDIESLKQTLGAW